MQQMNTAEIEQVSGGLTMNEGGLAIVGLAFVAPVGLVTCAALGIGLGLLVAKEYLDLQQ